MWRAVLLVVVLGPCNDASIDNAPWRIPDTLETHYDVGDWCRILYRAKASDIPKDMRFFDLFQRNREWEYKVRQEGVMAVFVGQPFLTILNINGIAIEWWYSIIVL